MNPVAVLPDDVIEPSGMVAQAFLSRNLKTFRQACQWIKDLPYGSNSSIEDSLILFEENRGTCTTKHGIIARLAQELGLAVYKNLGFYRLSDEIVTGVNRLLQPHDLTFIPQIHCFLEYGEFRIDLTEGNCNGKNKTIDTYDFVVRVNPDLTRAEEEQYYLTYLTQYLAIEPQLKAVGISTVFNLLEACNQQVKYQCSIMSSYHLASVEP